MRVAAIDCGTNTIRLLIADSPDRSDPRRGPEGQLVERERQLAYVRLGQGVDATGQFHPDALQRTFAAVDDFARVIAAAHVDQVRFVATSAARDVSNREEFFTGIENRLGIRPDIISGQEEAELSYLGATRQVGVLAEPILVVDIGGGSTELVVGRAGQIEWSHSLDLGSVRLTERLLVGDPVPPAAIAEAQALLASALDTLALPWSEIASWVGVAGTITTLAAIELGLAEYDRSRVHAAIVPRNRVIALADSFARSTAAERARIAMLPPQRGEVITAGALIAAAIAERVPVDLCVSETDILDGVALRLTGMV